ncbi:MAG: hypothetical protein HY905_01420 [Deltaproteobacteria bacterium]|nr:hypothetical protein [Deltaproteobacteria bacterium]
MTTVVLGTNRFVDCATLIAVQQHELLSIAVSPLRVSLTTPPGLPSGRVVNVVENRRQPESDPAVRVVASDTSVAIFWEESPLAIATVLDPSTVSLRLDLRSIGIDLFDDGRAVHLAGNLFSGNLFSGSRTVIALG